MGYNTAILIINDGLSDIEANGGQLGKSIANQICMGGESSLSVGSHSNAVQVMRTAHADTFRLYGSHGNLMVDIGFISRDASPSELDLVESYIKRAENSLEWAKKDIKRRRADLKKQNDNGS